MADPKTVPRWKIGLWIVLTALVVAWIGYSLTEGEIFVVTRHQTDHYVRSQDPKGFWSGIAFYAALLAGLAYSLLKAKPRPRTPPQLPDLTPRDWMGHPLDRK